MTPVTERERSFTSAERQRLHEEDQQALRAVMGILNGILLLALIGYTGVVLGIMVDEVTGVVAAVSVGAVSLFLFALWAWSRARSTRDASSAVGQRLSTPAVMTKFVAPERQPEACV